MEYGIPKSLLLEVTAKCNYHCPWCYCVWHEHPEQTMPNLPTGIWRKIIQAASRCGVRDLTFTGGEATLRPDWRDLLAFARQCSSKLRLALFSNGSRLTEEDVRFCREQGVFLSISLQGLRTYAEMTGTRRTYRRTIELLVHAREIQWPAAVSITANRTNLFELPDICGAAMLAGASGIQVNAMMLEGKARNRTDLALCRQDWERVKESLRERYPHYKRIYYSDETLCHCRFQPASLKAWDLQKSQECFAGTAFGVIDPQGYYRRCLHTTERIIHWKQLLHGGCT